MQVFYLLTFNLVVAIAWCVTNASSLLLTKLLILLYLQYSQLQKFYFNTGVSKHLLGLL
jgi:hypothetical protein